VTGLSRQVRRGRDPTMGCGHQVCRAECRLMTASQLVAADVVEQRVGSVVAAYDRQGAHRAGTDVDHRSAEWLAGCARRLGVEAELEPFALNRVDPQPS